MTRRHVLAATAALAATLALATPALAQGRGEIVMGAWGGGTSATWRTGVGEPFTARTGMPVRINEWPDPEPQLRAQAANPQYNMAIATYFNAANLHRDGLLETFDAKDIPALATVPDAYVLKAPDGKVIGVPSYFQYYGIAVNTDLAKTSDFQSWNDLAAAKWKGKLSVTRPIYASTYDLVMFARIAGGDEKNIAPGLPLMKALGANAVNVYNSMAQLNTLLTRGEVTAAPYYVTRVWGLKEQGARNVEFVLPKEGGLMLPYLLIVPKNAKHRDAYMAFLNFQLEPQQQLKMLDLSGYLPFNSTAQLEKKDVDRIGMPLKDLLARLYQPDWDVIARTHKERIDLVEQLLSR